MTAESQAGMGLDLARLGLLHSCWLSLMWSLAPQFPHC